MTHLISRFVADDRGSSAIEYGLIAGIIGIGLVIGLTSLRDALSGLFNSFSS